MDNLFTCNGKRFTANICDNYCNGKIFIEDGKVYLCQNAIMGSYCSNKGDFKYSWCVISGTRSNLIVNEVTNLIVYDDLLENISDIREIALTKAKSIFSDDDFIDVYINAFEEGAKYQKEQVK